MELGKAARRQPFSLNLFHEWHPRRRGAACAYAHAAVVDHFQRRIAQSGIIIDLIASETHIYNCISLAENQTMVIRFLEATESRTQCRGQDTKSEKSLNAHSIENRKPTGSHFIVRRWAFTRRAVLEKNLSQNSQVFLCTILGIKEDVDLSKAHDVISPFVSLHS